jgi:2-keto-4-pentenoate hydratase/2-oxohepta-3-ene-1,7-dioic acid hydratase in catechol pathway
VKFVVYGSANAAEPVLGLLTARGVVSVGDVVAGDSPQATLEHLIDGYTEFRLRLESLGAEGRPTPVHGLRLMAPVPAPGKILCTTAVYTRAAVEKQQLLMTLKSAESVIGPGETIRLPDVGDAWQFVPQAALGLVMRGPAKRVSAEAWRSAVFGYTCAIDVMARGDQQFGRDYWLAKADTLGPLGPCIVTVDEIPDPTLLRVRSWQSGTPAQDFSIGDTSHSIAEQVELATTVMTLRSGDVLVCGTGPDGQRPLVNGDQVEIEIEPIGRMALNVAVLAGGRSGA